MVSPQPEGAPAWDLRPGPRAHTCAPTHAHKHAHVHASNVFYVLVWFGADVYFLCFAWFWLLFSDCGWFYFIGRFFMLWNGFCVIFITLVCHAGWFLICFLWLLMNQKIWNIITNMKKQNNDRKIEQQNHTLEQAYDTLVHICATRPNKRQTR